LTAGIEDLVCGKPAPKKSESKKSLHGDMLLPVLLRLVRFAITKNFK
jgi:hypothetical protein